MTIVLDAWALLAYLQGEGPAASRVKAARQEAEAGRTDLFASLINIGQEVNSRIRLNRQACFLCGWK